LHPRPLRKSKKSPQITRDSNYYLGDNIDGDPVFVKYITYYDTKSDYRAKPHMLKYIGYYKELVEEAVDAIDTSGRNITKTKYITKIHPIYKTIPRKSYDKGGITYKEYWFDNSAIIENQELYTLDYVNKAGKQDTTTVLNYIPDGDEMLYFKHPSMEFENANDIVLVNDYNVILGNAFAGNTSTRNRLLSAADLAALDDTNISTRTVESTTPEFDKLPYKTATKTMTYAGIGSRETPKEVLDQMREVAMELSYKGYILNTGDAKGPDKAFSSVSPSNKTNIFTTKDSTDTTRAIAKEIHPNPSALSEYSLDLMARNTNQVFGENLDTPVDFVLYYAKPSNNPIRPQGGTGQAVEMANRKGIPTINMMDPNWRSKLNVVLGETTQTIPLRLDKELSTASSIYSQLGNKTVSSNVKLESWKSLKDMTSPFIKAYGSIVYIISTRIKGSDQHFGNPFTHDEKIKKNNPDLIKVGSIKEAVEKYIDWVLNSFDSRAIWIRSMLLSGELKNKQILYYTELGEPSHATALDYLINKFNIENYISQETTSTQLELFEEMTLSQLKDAVNTKFKDDPNHIPLTLKDMVNMSPKEINNLKNCL